MLETAGVRHQANCILYELGTGDMDLARVSFFCKANTDDR